MTNEDGPIDYDDDDSECWNCGGEGFVYGCSWDWQCDTWDGDSCLCTRPCHICHPPKDDPELRKLLGEFLAQGTPTRSAETTGSVGEADGGPVPAGDAPETSSSGD